MGSIPDRDLLVRQIKKTAHTVAYQKRLPWDLSTLRKAGYWAARNAQDEYLAKKDSLGVVSFEEYAQGPIGRAMLAAAERLHTEAADGEKAPPSTEEIEAALGAFTAKQWRELTRSLDRSDVDAVKSYVYADAQTPGEQKQREKELEQRFGAKEVNAFLVGIIMRGAELFSANRNERSKLVRLSDVYHAVAWEEDYRSANVLRAMRTHQAMREGCAPDEARGRKGRSLAEQAGARATATRLTKYDKVIGREVKVSAYTVDQWRKRVKELPFEEFEGDLLSYMQTIYSAKQFKNYLESRGKK